MFFPFECRNCRKDKWTIRYDSEDKEHTITCANCGHEEILEDIFNSRRRKKNVSRKRKQTSASKEQKTSTEVDEDAEKDAEATDEGDQASTEGLS